MRGCDTAYHLANSADDYEAWRYDLAVDDAAIQGYHDRCVASNSDCPSVGCPEWMKGCSAKDETPERQAKRFALCKEMTKGMQCPSSIANTLCYEMQRKCSCTEDEYRKNPHLKLACRESMEAFYKYCAWGHAHGLGTRFFDEWQTCIEDANRSARDCVAKAFLIEGPFSAAGGALAAGAASAGKIGLRAAMSSAALSGGLIAAAFWVAGQLASCEWDRQKAHEECERKVQRSLQGKPGGF